MKGDKPDLYLGIKIDFSALSELADLFRTARVYQDDYPWLPGVDELCERVRDLDRHVIVTVGSHVLTRME